MRKEISNRISLPILLANRLKKTANDFETSKERFLSEIIKIASKNKSILTLAGKKAKKVRSKSSKRKKRGKKQWKRF